MAIKRLASVFTTIAGGRFCQNVFNWEVDDSLTTPSYVLAKDLLTALQAPAAGDAFLTKMMECMADDAYCSSIRCKVISVSGAPAATKIFPPTSHPGTFGGTIDSAQQCGLIVWLTSGNAGQNGRTFLPGCSEGAYNGDRRSDEYFDSINEFIAVAVAPVESATQEYKLVLKNSAGTVFTPITRGYLSPDAGTQRKRLVPY